MFFCFRSIFLLAAIFRCGEPQLSNRGIVFEPNHLVLPVGTKNGARLRIIAEVNQSVSVNFIYGKRRSPTTDFIKMLDPISFDRNTFPLVNVETKRPGHVIIGYSVQPTLQAKLTGKEFLHIDIPKSLALNQFINLLGWAYFLAWSISFYPQIILNYQRKSVVGLNFDFLALNLLGFFCYSVFNIGLFWSNKIQESYRIYHPHGIIPVMLSDVIFSVHGFFVTLFTIIQCFLYERSNQRVSPGAIFFIVLSTILLSLSSILAAFGGISILFLIYLFSYVKLSVSIIKYIPQAVMNYRRKSTDGWSIGNILLDLSGGILSFIQMIFLAMNYDDWASIFGSFTKLGLSLVSIGFDIVFILQHYVFYRNKSAATNGSSAKLENKS